MFNVIQIILLFAISAIVFYSKAIFKVEVFRGSSSKIRYNETDNFRVYRRLLSYLPPINGEYTDYSGAVKPIPETTSKKSVNMIFEKLTKLNPSFNNDISKSLEFDKAISLLEQSSGGWDKNLKRYRNDEFLSSMNDVINGRFDNPTNIFESISNGMRVEDLIDIVIITNNCTSNQDWTSFLENWKRIIFSLHLTIIQTGDPTYPIEIPNWANYILYNSDDIKRALGHDAWIYDVDSCSMSARSFGLLIADNDYVFFLDSSMKLPTGNESIYLLDEHLLNLLTPSNPYYFNTLHDPYRYKNDFPRGYPHSLKEGVPTVISQGHILGDAAYDIIAQIVKKNEIHEKISDISQTVLHGALFSFFSQNVAFYRKMAGPCMYFPSASSLPNLDIGPAGELITGWFCKVIIDHIRGGVKSGGRTYINVIENNNYNKVNESLLIFKKLQKELIWSSCCAEKVVRFFAEAVLTTTKDSAPKAVDQLATLMHDDLGKIHPAFQVLAKAFKGHLAFYDKLNGFNTVDAVAVASRSSYHKVRSSITGTNYSHNCAAFTIVRPSEPFMLPVWIRYYSKHFPESLFVYRHIINVTNAFGQEAQSEPNSTISNKVKYYELRGHPHGFAVSFLAWSATEITKRLLRAGYSCVLYSDVDEIIAPDPVIYPHGLAQYVSHFVKEMPNQVIRAQGYNIAHVSESVKNKEPLEKPLDWSKSILNQRSYWLPNGKYNKPLLTKVVTKWKAGFHTAFLPLTIHIDMNLYLLHLTDVDKTFCLEREKQKYLVYDKLGASAMKSSGFNNHIGDYARTSSNGHLCRLARSMFDPNKNAVVDYKDIETLHKMDDSWKTVEV